MSTDMPNMGDLSQYNTISAKNNAINAYRQQMLQNAQSANPWTAGVSSADQTKLLSDLRTTYGEPHYNTNDVSRLLGMSDATTGNVRQFRLKDWMGNNGYQWQDNGWGKNTPDVNAVNSAMSSVGSNQDYLDKSYQGGAQKPTAGGLSPARNNAYLSALQGRVYGFIFVLISIGFILIKGLLI